MRRVARSIGLAIALTSCSGAKTLDPVIAQIAGRSLTQSEFEGYVKASREDEEGAAPGELKAALLDQLIEERLLLKAAEDAGIEVESPEARKRDTGSAPAAAKTWRVDPAAYLRIRKLMFERILADISVSDREVQAHYEEQREQFRRPEVVDVSEILLEVGEEAEKIREELAAHPNRFETLARERSVGPEAPRGGYLGTFRRGELPSAFEAEVFGVTKGHITPVVRTTFGFHIFRVNAVNRPRALDLKEAQDAIRVDLMRKKSDDALAHYLTELRKKYPVEVFTDKLNFAYQDRKASGE